MLFMLIRMGHIVYGFVLAVWHVFLVVYIVLHRVSHRELIYAKHGVYGSRFDE